MAPFRWLYAWLDRVVCVLAALLVAQAPVFTEQYLAELNQARARTEVMYQQTVRTASQLNLPVAEYLSRLKERGSPAEQDSLDVVAQTLIRHDGYQAAYDRLHGQPAWLRPPILLFDMDANVRKATTFQPGLPLSFAGLIYAALGLTLGWLLMALFPRLVRRRAPSHP
jgi:hypothetical protein